jgi:hypothetical protein
MVQSEQRQARADKASDAVLPGISRLDSADIAHERIGQVHCGMPRFTHLYRTSAGGVCMKRLKSVYAPPMGPFVGSMRSGLTMGSDGSIKQREHRCADYVHEQGGEVLGILI